MGAEPRRYTFPPLERRGVLLGLQAGQLATLATGCLLAVGIVRRGSSTAGLAVAGAVVVASAGAACWPVAGRPPVAWLPLLGTWVLRRRQGPYLGAEPTAGRLAAGTPAAGTPAGAARKRSFARGIDLLEAPEPPGAEPLGVIRDRLDGSCGAVIRVGGKSFALLDPAEKERRLAAWGALLAAVARPGSPVHRLQWVERALPGNSDDLVRYLEEAGVAGAGVAGDARRSYEALIAGAGPATERHECFLVLSVHPRKALRTARTFGRGDVAACELLRREVRLLVGQLRSANLPAAQPLSFGQLQRALGDGTDVRPTSMLGAASSHRSGPVSETGSIQRRGPGSAGLGAFGAPWPLAADEAWSALRADGGWHATYWVAEWPRVDVGPDFLTPLVASNGRRRVSLVMAPVDPQRAVREAGSARTADLADAELRRRSGFVPSARREREAAGVVRRESELADGHAEYRFSGYVTVSAGDRSELDEQCAEIEQAAQQAHLELRRLWGRQQEAYTWTLPLGRGLA